MSYFSVNILDLEKASTEEEIQEFTQNFSTPINPDIEHFLKGNALSFSKKHQSITYLVFDESEDMDVVGYFTLTIRQISINCESASKSAIRKVKQFGKFDEGSSACQASAFLIAQFGKNFLNNKITGKELMDCAIQQILKIQRQIGCGLVFLEAEDHEKLLAFYQNDDNRFIPFDDRITDDGVKLVQLYRFI